MSLCLTFVSMTSASPPVVVFALPSPLVVGWCNTSTAVDASVMCTPRQQLAWFSLIFVVAAGFFIVAKSRLLTEEVAVKI